MSLYPCRAVAAGTKGLKGEKRWQNVMYIRYCDWVCDETPPTDRDEQYRSLWTELENFTQAYSKNSEKHQTLLTFLQDVMSHCASVQVARKTPSTKGTCTVGMIM